MIITRELATYLEAVTVAVTMQGKTEIPLTTTCPECGVDLELDDTDAEHMLIKTTSDTVAVVVGCEGYWVIDPALVGVGYLAPNWSDGTALGDEATGVHEGSCSGNHGPERGCAFPNPPRDGRGFVTSKPVPY